MSTDADEEASQKADDRLSRITGGNRRVPDGKTSDTPPSKQSSEDASMVDREHANKRAEENSPDGLGRMIEALMDTPIDPRPGFKPPLDVQQAFYLSAETEEMLDAAVTVMKQEVSRENRKEASKSIVAEIALRSLLFDFVENREDSHLMEWFRSAFGPED